MKQSKLYTFSSLGFQSMNFQVISELSSPVLFTLDVLFDKMNIDAADIQGMRIAVAPSPQQCMYWWILKAFRRPLFHNTSILSRITISIDLHHC